MCIERTVDFSGKFLMRIGAKMSFFKIPYIYCIDIPDEWDSGSVHI